MKILPILCFLLCTNLQAQTYIVTDLGTVGGKTSAASGINNLGQVVGKAENAQSLFRATLFSGSGSANIDLGTLGGTQSQATAINESGQIVGDAMRADGDSHATIFSYPGHEVGPAGNVDLGTLGGKSSSANAINDRGDIVGTADIATTPYFSAASFRMDQAPVSLGGLGGYYSGAFAINSEGRVAGFASVPNDAQHAVFFGAPQTNIDACNLPGNSYVRDINYYRRMVGYRLDSGFPRATMFQIGATPVDLGTLGGKTSYANAINDAGVIVGSAALPGDTIFHGYVYREGAMVDLNSLIPANANVVITSANDINERQQIAANGLVNGVKHALRLDLSVAPPPVPPPPIPTLYKIIVLANPVGKGTVKGSRFYAESSEVVVIAKARQGRKFLGWTEARKIVSRNKTYRFTATRPRELVARFQ